MFLTYAEAAKEARISVSLIRKMARQRTLKVVKFNRAARIPRRELEKLCRSES
jgi:excisionase family DNA binding protein